MHQIYQTGCQRCRGQAGFSLIEVIMSIVIMSTIILAVVAAIVTLQYTSQGHRKTVLSSIEATDVAEAIELMNYVNCADVDDYDAALSGLGAGYTAEVTEVKYLENKGVDSASFIGGCTVDAEGKDQGVQRLTITVTATGPRGGTEDLVYTKREDACPTDPKYVGADC